MRSVWTSASAAVNSLIRKFGPRPRGRACRSCGRRERSRGRRRDRDEHAALARRHGLGGVERVHAGVAPRPGAPAVPLGAVRVGAVLDEEDALGGAQRRDLPDLEGKVAADVHEQRGLRPVSAQLGLEVVQRRAQVVAVAVDEDRPAARRQDGQRRGHEGVRRAQHGLPADPGELERGERASRPRAGRDGARAIPGGPGVLEAPRHRALGPLLGVDHLVPERMQTLSIATIEADGKARELGSTGGQGAVKLPAAAAAAGRHPPTNSHSAGAMRPVS